VTQKKREILKNSTKIEEIQEKKFIDRNWTVTTCLSCPSFVRIRDHVQLIIMSSVMFITHDKSYYKAHDW